MRLAFRPAVAGLVVLSSVVAALGAADDPADVTLKEKGLRKTGTTYVLAAEADVQKKLNEARAAYKQLAAALAQQQGYERDLWENKQDIRELTEQRIMLSQQIPQAANQVERNQFIMMYNNAGDRLNLLNQQQEDEGAKRQIDAQAARRREAYVQVVLDLRQLVDETTEAYEELADDPAVKDALEKVNAKSKVKSTLGPSKSFLANVALLEKAEASVLSESVNLRKEGGIYWVNVTFNGKVTRPMAFDTGAAAVVLPADLAAEVGLKPGQDDPIVRCQVADGTIVEARQMTVPSMRVGKFTVKDVVCTVMPADKKDVPPLLGQTFQRNFLLKFSPDSGTLVLSKVETPETAAAATPAKGKASTRPSAKTPAGKRTARPGAAADAPF